MGVMRLLAALLCTSALLACQREQPVYESQYTEPSTAETSSASTPSVPAAAWKDDFDRPDGPLGDGWDLRGPYVDSFPMPPATDGFIRDGAFTYAGDAVVYASRRFPETVTRVGTIGRWSAIGEGSETGIALVISANDNLVSDMVHLVVNRHVWTLTVRRSGDGAFEPVANGVFDPPLAMSRDYSFELEADDDAVTIRLPGREPVVSSVLLNGLVGPYAFWEEYADPLPAGTAFEFDTVWAD